MTAKRPPFEINNSGKPHEADAYENSYLPMPLTPVNFIAFDPNTRQRGLHRMIADVRSRQPIDPTSDKTDEMERDPEPLLALAVCATMRDEYFEKQFTPRLLEKNVVVLDNITPEQAQRADLSKYDMILAVFDVGIPTSLTKVKALAQQVNVPSFVLTRKLGHPSWISLEAFIKELFEKRDRPLSRDTKQEKRTPYKSTHHTPRLTLPKALPVLPVAPPTAPTSAEGGTSPTAGGPARERSLDMNESTIEQTFGQALRAIRQKEGLSTEELGELIGVSHSAVNHWENDQSAPIIEHALKIFMLFPKLSTATPIHHREMKKPGSAPGAPRSERSEPVHSIHSIKPAAPSPPPPPTMPTLNSKVVRVPYDISKVSNLEAYNASLGAIVVPMKKTEPEHSAGATVQSNGGIRADISLEELSNLPKEILKQEATRLKQEVTSLKKLLRIIAVLVEEDES